MGQFIIPKNTTAVQGIPIGRLNDLERRLIALEAGGGGGGISGSGTANYLAVWNGASSVTGYSGAQWNPTTERLTVYNSTSHANPLVDVAGSFLSLIGVGLESSGGTYGAIITGIGGGSIGLKVSGGMIGIESTSGINNFREGTTIYADYKMVLDADVSSLSWIGNDYSDTYGFGAQTNILAAELGNFAFINGTDNSGASLNAGSLTLSGLTSGRIPTASTGGLLVDYNNFKFDGSSLLIGGNVNIYNSTTDFTTFSQSADFAAHELWSDDTMKLDWSGPDGVYINILLDGQGSTVQAIDPSTRHLYDSTGTGQGSIWWNDRKLIATGGSVEALNWSSTTSLTTPLNFSATGTITGSSIIKSGGTSSQFLKADGSIDSTTYLSGTVQVSSGGTGAITLADNSILTGTGTGAITAESTLTYDGTTHIQNVNSGYIKQGVPTSGFGAIGFNSGTLALTNASLYGNGTNTYVGAPTGGIISSRINNVEQFQVSASAVTVQNGSFQINGSAFASFVFNGPSSGVFQNLQGALFFDQQANNVINFRTNGGNYRMVIHAAGNITFGSTTDYGAKINAISTTEQSRLLYDVSNYFSTTVGSTGGVTFNAVGSGAAFTFSDPVTINGLLTLSAQNIATDTTTGMKIGTGTTQKIGVWNATPIVQPTTSVTEATFVENAGGVAVNDDSTFDGYTLGQVVKALRNIGLLA